MQRVFLAIAAVAVIGIGACSRRPVQATGADSVSPEPDTAAHQAILDRERRGPVRVLFLGDSVTHGWADVPSIFDEAFGEDAPCNGGVMLDRVQNVRGRIANGELDGIDPDVILLQ